MLLDLSVTVAKVAEEQEEWDQFLPKVLLALRASTHETTGFSPSMLMFGRELRLPIDAMREGPPSEQPPDYPSFVKRQQEILKGVYGRVGENLRVNLRHQKDVCSVPRWVHRKFYRPWSGPWRVVKVISDVTYRIQCEEATPTRERRK